MLIQRKWEFSLWFEFIHTISMLISLTSDIFFDETVSFVPILFAHIFLNWTVNTLLDLFKLTIWFHDPIFITISVQFIRRTKCNDYKFVQFNRIESNEIEASRISYHDFLSYWHPMTVWRTQEFRIM